MAKKENGLINQLAKRQQHIQKKAPIDISLQVTIPNEWERMAPINIGYTAGIETTKVAPQWIEKAKLMDKIIVVSNHSKNVFENTTYTGTKSRNSRRNLIFKYSPN